MKIGIIGAGHIGGNLTRRLTALGHDVSVANSRGPETLKELAEETGATPVRAEEAARGAEIVVVTVPLKAVPDLPSGLLDGAAEDVAVIDTGNYYPQRDGRIAGIEDEGLTESRWTERQIGHPVIKAFNGTYAHDLIDRARPEGPRQPPDETVPVPRGACSCMIGIRTVTTHRPDLYTAAYTATFTAYATWTEMRRPVVKRNG